MIYMMPPIVVESTLDWEQPIEINWTWRLAGMKMKKEDIFQLDTKEELLYQIFKIGEKKEGIILYD